LKVKNQGIDQTTVYIHSQTIIENPVEVLKAGDSEQVFLSEVEKGITLCESGSNEPCIQ
jgi:hypothetical protein